MLGHTTPHQTITLILTTWCLVCGTALADLRDWTSSDGKYRLRAELVSFDGVNVRLKKPDGSVVTVKASQLSATDRKFLARQPNRSTPNPANDELAKRATIALAELGIRTNSLGLYLDIETELSKKLRVIAEYRKNLLAAQKSVERDKEQEIKVQQHISNLLLLNAKLNAQLAVRPRDPSSNNRLVAAINSNSSQIDLVRTGLKQQATAAAETRAKTNEIREKYLQAVLDMRQQIDKISQRYLELKSSKAAQSAIRQLQRATGGPIELVESRGFERAKNRLEALEKTVLSKSIPLRHVGGGSLIVSVVIDGKPPQDMVLDSGANLVTLPLEIATKCGVVVGPGDRRIVMSLADGSRISGHLVTIKSMRVGQFTAENVECAVLGAEAVNAPALLGMSYLRNFKFEVDATARQLNIVKIDASDE